MTSLFNVLSESCSCGEPATLIREKGCKLNNNIYLISSLNPVKHPFGWVAWVTNHIWVEIEKKD